MVSRRTAQPAMQGHVHYTDSIDGEHVHENIRPNAISAKPRVGRSNHVRVAGTPEKRKMVFP